MADVAASDVAYTLQEGTQSASPSDPKYKAVFKLVFGDGALTYPSGGIPLTKAKLGCPANLLSFKILDGGAASGVIVKYDYANQKLRLYNSVSAHTHDIKAIGGLTSSEALFLDASQKFGKTAATDRTIVGSTSATTGGVVNSAVASGVELGNVAFAAITMYAEVAGY